MATADALPIRGLYIVPRHAYLILERKKRLIVKLKPIPNKLIERGKSKSVVYLVTQDGQTGLNLGRIWLLPPFRIDLKDFARLRRYHLITDEERQKWWPKAEKLYAYRFRFKKFNKPKIIKIPRGVQTLVKLDSLLTGVPIERLRYVRDLLLNIK